MNIELPFVSRLLWQWTRHVTWEQLMVLELRATTHGQLHDQKWCLRNLQWVLKLLSQISQCQKSGLLKLSKHMMTKQHYVLPGCIGMLHNNHKLSSTFISKGGNRHYVSSDDIRGIPCAPNKTYKYEYYTHGWTNFVLVHQKMINGLMTSAKSIFAWVVHVKLLPIDLISILDVKLFTVIISIAGMTNKIMYCKTCLLKSVKDMGENNS